MEQRYYQQILLERVKDQMPENQSVVDHITDILDLSKDSAYRRLRNETSLSFDEAIKLASHFHIPMNELVGSTSQSAVFNRHSSINSLQAYRDYLQQSILTLNSIKEQRKHQMIYSAKDIPIFYQFAFPKLTAFKIYVWLKSVYDIQTIDSEYYSLRDIPQDLLDLAREQWSLFSQINTIEIWNDTTILSLINQIAYYYEAGMLTDEEEALAICDEFQEMIKIIYKQAVSGQKLHASNPEVNSGAFCKMYYHEILIMDNHILAEFGDNQHLYLVPYAGLNYMSTSDPELVKSLTAYLQAQIRKSALMSDVSEKERNKFFFRIKAKIDQLRDKIKATNPFE